MPMTSTWPNAATRGLFSDDLLKYTRARFLEDRSAYTYVSAAVDPGPTLQLQLSRTVFKTTPVRQLQYGFEKPDDLHEVGKLVEERWSGGGSTACIEDLNGLQKNNGQMRGSMIFRRPPRAMAVAIAHRWLSNKHRYNQLEANIAVPRRTAKLKRSAYGVKPGKPSIDVRGIASSTAKASWFSPEALNLGISAGDHACWRFAQRFDRSADLEYTAANAFCEALHTVIFRRTGGAKAGKIQWSVGLFNYTGSACVVQPINLKEVPGHHDQKYVEFDTTVTEPTFAVILDWSKIYAFQGRWRSWAHLCHRFPHARGKWGPAVRMLAESSYEKSLDKLAAENGFWSIVLTLLIQIATMLKIAMPKGVTLFDCLLIMIKSILKCSDEQAMKYIANRFRWSRKKNDTLKEVFMNNDDVSSCLAREDVKIFDKEQKRVSEENDDNDVFTCQFKAKAKALREKAAGDKKDAKGKKPAVRKVALARAMVDMVDQSEAKKLMPPVGNLWKSRADCAWHVHVEPFGEHSRTVRKPHALHWVLCRAWEDFALLDGSEPSDHVDGYEPEVPE